MNSPRTQQFTAPYLKTGLPEIKVGDTVKLHGKISAFANAAADKKEGERIQIFEGMVIAKKHGKGITGSMTVRKIVDGIGVEKTVPLHSPNLVKIEVIAHGKTRRAKLYYLRARKGKKANIKRKEISKAKAPQITEIKTQSPEKAKA